MQQKIPFGQEYDIESAKSGKGVKLKNKRTVTSNEEFEKKANEFIADKTERNQSVIAASKKVVDLSKEKTLVQNKTVMARDIEQQIITEFVQSGLAINQDPSEPEGYGSAAMIHILCKIIMTQRDRINNMEFELSKHKITERVAALEISMTNLKKEVERSKKGTPND